jgi:hypothetical protein
MGGPIPFDRDQAFRKTPAKRRAERVETLAATLALPREALTTDPKAPEALRRRLPEGVPVRAFRDPDPFNELMFPSVLAAKRAIAQSLEVPPREAEPTRARGDRRHCAADSMGAAIRGRHPCHFHLDSLLPP